MGKSSTVDTICLTKNMFKKTVWKIGCETCWNHSPRLLFLINRGAGIFFFHHDIRSHFEVPQKFCLLKASWGGESPSGDDPVAFQIVSATWWLPRDWGTTCSNMLFSYGFKFQLCQVWKALQLKISSLAIKVPQQTPVGQGQRQGHPKEDGPGWQPRS